MDKYLKMFKPAMTKWLRDHYPIEEAKTRWKKTVYLDEKWIREEGDLNFLIDVAMGKFIGMLSHFDMNRLLRHKWIVGAINRYLPLK